MRGIWAAGMFGLTLAGAALAEAPDTSLRPVARPAALAAPAVPEPAARVALDSTGAILRPKPRPATLASAPQIVMARAGVAVAPAKQALFPVLRPFPRPKDLAQKQLVAAAVAPVKPGKQGVVSRKGSVCGDPSIRGAALAPITSRVKGCGIADPVQITSVAGIRLSQAATMDCDTALALRAWIERGVEPAFGRGKVVELQVAGHYVCRTRNHRAGAKISEHGRGRAIDISGFTLSNGKTLTVRQNFDRTMRKAHKAACGIFKTTLGPGSDGMHEDHLHLDVAKRGGTYCR